MTRSDPQKYADRIYRSGSAIAAGVLLLGLAGLLTGEALLRGEGRTPIMALTALVLIVPLVTAFTLRPAVFAGDDRLRVRNPFRTIVAPWSAVEAVRAKYSCEVVAGGTTYQLWAIPVSLRARSKAARHNERLASGQPPRAGVFGLGGGMAPKDEGERTASSDAAVAELQELAERRAEGDESQAEVTVRWAYEILVPLAVGALALLVLWATA